MPDLTPRLLLQAYAAGIFPMAESREDPRLFWVDPDQRGIFPLDQFHVPRRLRRVLRRDTFQVTCDRAFRTVIHSCAQPTARRPETWINGRILELYESLFRMGFCHSVECWRDGRLVGGLYGLALGGAFFGESMFSREPDASKIALVHLVARLRVGGYALLDTQFVTDHLRQFGAIEVPREDYQLLLAAALETRADFPTELPPGGLESLWTSPPPAWDREPFPIDG